MMDSSTQKNLESVAELLTLIKETYRAGTRERELLLLAKNVCFFVFLEKSAEFDEFMDALSRETD
jgi:hypothetical protein